MNISNPRYYINTWNPGIDCYSPQKQLEQIIQSCQVNVCRILFDDTTYDAEAVIKSVSNTFCYHFEGDTRIEGPLNVIVLDVGTYDAKKKDKLLEFINSKIAALDKFHVRDLDAKSKAIHTNYLSDLKAAKAILFQNMLMMPD